MKEKSRTCRNAIRHWFDGPPLTSLQVAVTAVALFWVLPVLLLVVLNWDPISCWMRGDKRAEWVAAIGSIIAIFGSYYIGAHQAAEAHRSAMKIYEAQRADQVAAESNRKRQAAENSLIAIATTTASIRRLQRDVVALIIRLDHAVTRCEQADRAFRAVQSMRQDAHIQGASPQQQETNESIEERRQAVAERMREELAQYIDEIDQLIARVNALPRTEISVTRPDLGNLIVVAINALHRAATEIAHDPRRAKITDWMREADRALDKFVLDLASEAAEDTVAKAVRNLIPFE